MVSSYKTSRLPNPLDNNYATKAAIKYPIFWDTLYFVNKSRNKSPSKSNDDPKVGLRRN